MSRKIYGASAGLGLSWLDWSAAPDNPYGGAIPSKYKRKGEQAPEPFWSRAAFSRHPEYVRSDEDIVDEACKRIEKAVDYARNHVGRGEGQVASLSFNLRHRQPWR